MRVSLDFEVVQWLSSLGVLAMKQAKNTGRIELDEATSKLFMNGIKFGETLQKTLSQRGIHVQLVESMKNQMSAGVRLYNWNLLQDAFQKMNLPLDNDIKSMIVQGDLEMLNELLKDLMGCSPIRVSSQSKREASRESPQIKPEMRESLSDSPTLLDFFVNGLSRQLQLTSGQCASLLQNGNKYLAHLLVKGVKGEFESLTNWLSEIYANLKRIYQFFEQDQSNISLFLSTVKPGLLSKEQEITLWTLRIMGRVFFELAEMELHQVGYEWFSNQGLNASFMCLQRHPQLMNQLCELFAQIARYNVTDFFTVQFRKTLDDKCIDSFNNIIHGLSAQKLLREELIAQGVIQYWSQQAQKLADSEVLSQKTQGLTYLTNMWLLFGSQFEEDNKPTQYLFIMKKCTRDASEVLQLFALNHLFRLLEALALDRNPFAAVLYKKLTFTLIENYQNWDLRDFMIHQFMHMIQKFSNIPIDILLEPLIKQIQMNDASMNLSDMLLMKFIVQHPKMKVRLAILLLDVLSKIYLNHLTMSGPAYKPIQVLLSRFAESTLMREYAFKLSKIALALHYGSLKSKRNIRVNDLSVLSQMQQHQSDQDIFAAQKRAQIIELLKFIIGMQQDELNSQIKPLLCHFYLELQSIKIRDKGIITLLNLFGDPQKIVQDIQAQWDKERDIQEQVLQRSQVLIDNEFQEDAPSQHQTTPAKSQKSMKSESDPFKDLKQQELQEEKAFLQNNGVGFKKRVVDVERANVKQTIAKTKVDPKVLENIAQIKMKKEEEQLRIQQEEEEKQKRIQQLTRKAQQEIQKRVQVVVPKYDLIELDDWENMDQESMQTALKRHQKALRYLFSKYSNTTNQASKKQYFGELQDQFSVIQQSDILRMIKDYSVSLSKEETQGLIRALNIKYSDKDGNTMDYDNFEKFIVQLALREKQLRMPAGSSMDQFIGYLGQQARIRNENHLIFTDPDSLSIDPDREQIRQLNQQLIITPDMPIPAKFKKHTEKHFALTYEYKNVLQNLPQSWVDCHSIVDSIIAETFHVHVMEPKSEIKLISKIKHKLTDQQQTAPKSIKDGSVKKVTNKAIEDKMQKQQAEELKKQEAEEKRKKYQEKLKQEYLRKKREKDEEEQLKKQEERQQLIMQADRERAKQELLKKEAEEKKLKLREYKDQQQEQNKIKEQKHIEEQKAKLEQDRKVREEFNKKQKEEMKKQLEDIQKAYKDKQEEDKLKEQQKKVEMQEWKNNVQQMLKEEQEMRQRERQAQVKIVSLYQDPQIQQIFKKYEKSLQIVYHSYQEYADFKIESTGNEKDLLQLKGFTNFASQFNIYPAILLPEDAQLIFRSLQRERERQQQVVNEKQGFTEQATTGMSYSEFEQALLRIAIKGQKYFDILADKYNANMNTVEMIALKKDQNEVNNIALDKKEDSYAQVEMTSAKTVQGLFHLLDIPDDKNELQAKLRALKLEYQKVAAQRDKKQVVAQKLGEDIKGARRNQSVNKDAPQQKQSKNLSKDRQPPQKIQRAPSAMSQKTNKSLSKEKLVAVNESQLKSSQNRQIEAIGPDGKKEKWELNQES